MTDTITTPQRHNNMAAIRGKDTKPEKLVRRFLWSRGFRYRLNYPRLPGKPDVVLRKYRTCIFVNGCFWHGHNVDFGADNQNVSNSDCCKIPHTNRDFWVSKIVRNQKRDEQVKNKLADMGWNSITIWECQLKPSCRQQTLESLAFMLNRLFQKNLKANKYAPADEELFMAAEN